MKRIILTLVAIFSLITSMNSAFAGKSNYEQSPMQIGKDDKLAILVVHFGTTHADTEKKTIKALNDKINKLHPDTPIFEAYTSRIIIKKLGERGITKLTPSEVLSNLKAQGFTHVLIQSSNIIDGVEMESLRREVREQGANFKDIRLGNPLLYTPEDYLKVAKAMQSYIPSNTDAVLLIGHGTYTPITASYVMMDYVLKNAGQTKWYVTTIEGYPTFEMTLEQLKKAEVKSVTLAPFMFVAGEHAKNDIAGDIKEELEAAGIKVNLFIQGLGENSEILNIFVEHLDFAKANRYLDIMEKKEQYSK